MDFWPKRWGGRNFDGDKGLGTVQTLGLPFAKQVNGNTTARKIGEFSETVIKEDQPAYFISGYVMRDGVTRFETYTAENYNGVFTRYPFPVYLPLGNNEYLYGVATYSELLVSNVVYAYRWSYQISLFRGRFGGTPASASFDAVGPVIPSSRVDIDDEDGITNIYRLAVTSQGGYGNGPSSFALFSQSWGLSKDFWDGDVSGVQSFIGDRVNGAVIGNVPSLPGMERCHLIVAASATFAPDSFALLVVCSFSPHPYNAAYQGGDVYLYKTTDGGASYFIAPITAIKTNLPGPPDLRNPTATPEGYLRLPADINCRLNVAIHNISVSATMVVCTPTKWFMSLVNYKNIGGVWRNAGEMYVTNDAGGSWSLVPFPALLENHDPPKPAKVESVVYLGQGRMLAKVRSSIFGNNNLWNLIRSENYGATWTCIPKVGLPTATAPYSFFTGNFKVLRKRTTAKTAIVVLTAWDGGAYSLYESKDEGFTWRKVAKLAASEQVYGLEDDIDDGELQNSFGSLIYLGTEDEPAPLSIETPWRFDRRIPYEDE